MSSKRVEQRRQQVRQRQLRLWIAAGAVVVVLVLAGEWWTTRNGASSGGTPIGRISANGLQVEYVETAAASYTADDQDHTIVLTAATAEAVLPPAADGKQKYLVQFTGASSRTVTPDGSDTVDVSSPTQNKHYWVQSDGVSHWKMVLMD